MVNYSGLGARAQERMSRINQQLSTLPVPTVSNISKRIHGMTWQAYPIGLGTASGYILLANLKHHPAFLKKIEIFLFILNIIIFLTTTALLAIQAALYPKQFCRVATDPNKNSFIPTSVLCFATIIVGIVNYGRPLGITDRQLIGFFWAYVSLALFITFCVLTIWFSTPRNPTASMTPAWAFPVFPLLMTGVVTFNVLNSLPLENPSVISIYLTGLLMFGSGAFMCIFYLAIFMLRIMTTGFLDGHQANGAFVAAGPPGFSALVLFRLGKIASKLFPIHGLISPNAGEIAFVGCTFVGIMLTGCSTVLFIMAAIPYWTRLHKHLDEILGCWAVTFPNMGLILAFRFLGDTFDSHVCYGVQTALTITIFLVYLIVLALTSLAVYKGLVLMSDDKSVNVDDLCWDEKKDLEKGQDGSRQDNH